MIKLFLSDLDGTLIDNRANISNEDLKAITKLKKEKIDFGFVTGRDRYFCDCLIEKYQLKINNNIINNGSMIIKDDKVVFHKYLSQKLIDMVIKEAENYLNDIYIFSTDDQGNVYFLKDKYDEKQWEHIKIKCQEFGRASEIDLNTYLKDHQVCIISGYSENNSLLHSFCNKLNEKTDHKYEITVSSTHFFDALDRGINKGNALLELLKILNLKLEEVAIIGDGLNDLSLFENCKYSFAMEKADDVLKNKAYAVVSSVSCAIDKIILENKYLKEKKRG